MMRSERKGAFLVLVLFTVASLYCRKQNSIWQGSISEEDGVIVVSNPKEPMYGEEVVSLEEELTLGEKEGNEEYMFSRPHSIDVDGKGNIYVLDVKESHIKIFDEDGIHKKTFGRKGQGPGELQGPLAIQITENNELLVNNLTSSRLNYFSLEGEFLREDHMTGIPRSLFQLDSNGDYICAYPEIGQIFKVVLAKFNSNQKRMFSIAEIEPNYEENYSGLAKSIIFCVTKDNDIVWAITDKYEIMITDAYGNLARKITREYDPVAISDEEKKRLLKEIPLRPGMSFPKHFPPLKETFLSADEGGRIYVGTYEKMPTENVYFYDVFDLEGKYIAKIPIKHTKRSAIVWKNDKLYTIEEDDEGYQFVKRYNVNWSIN